MTSADGEGADESMGWFAIGRSVFRRSFIDSMQEM